MNHISIRPYQPGVLGETVRHHAIYYARHWNFDVRFETQVACELSEFIIGYSESRDGFWWAASGNTFAGAVAVDGTAGQKGVARIRWFIVPERFQGEGVGAMLFRQAMEFCRKQRFTEVYLWTFAGLDAARKLYERNGFQLVHQQQGTPWGPVITEQKFKLMP